MAQSRRSDHINRAWMHTGPGPVELTAVLLSRAVRAENHRIEIGLEGVEGVVMLGHQGFREALEEGGPV